MRHARSASVVLAIVLALSGCGTFTSTQLEPRAAGGTPPYAGPLDVPVTALDSYDPMERSGAAGKTLECDGEVVTGGAYEEGWVEHGRSAPDALENFTEFYPRQVPRGGYRVEVERDQHLLLSYDVAGRTRAAVIIAKTADAQHADLPWAMSTFAACDQAEFPASVDADFGRRIWVNGAGKRMPTSVVNSYFGASHCNWETVTFLTLNGKQFLSDPKGVFKDTGVVMRTSYEKDTVLPADAVDTGYRLDGSQLWKDSDAEAVFVVTADSVERWPGVAEPLGCM